MIQLFAKSFPKETIKEHTNRVLEQYEVLKDIYPNIPNLDWRLLYLACFYHDLGKHNTKFQNKIRDVLSLEPLPDQRPFEPEVHHGYLSVAFVPIEELKEIYSKDQLRVLCQAIFYHHTRPEQDFELIKKTVDEDLPLFHTQMISDGWPDFKINSKYRKYTMKARIPTYEESPETFYRYIMIKGLLNKIDFAASTVFRNNDVLKNIDVEVKNNGLLEKTLKFMDGNHYKLNDLQQYLMDHQEENNIVVASTGIGKTEGALLWIGNDKGFFTLPLKVSINVMYNRIVDKIDFQSTGVLHSDTAAVYAEKMQNEFTIEHVQRTKQLSFPLTVCTLDQIIDFVFLYPGFELKLATLAYSKLVVDEIQMYSPELVAFLLLGLKKITDLGGKYTILTATFPPVFEHFMKKLKIPYNKAPKPFMKKNADGSDIIRHRLSVEHEDLSINKIIQCYENNRILVIVNTVKKAQEIYEALKDCMGEGEVHLLHSRFIGKDRREKEEAILVYGEKECTESCIWVTTQIVEASLDIDFDILITELSEVSGLFQRMGRVYRNRTYNNELPNVFVYLGKGFTSGVGNSKHSIVDPTVFTISKEVIAQYHNQYIDESLKMSIVEKVYDYEMIKGSDYCHKIRTKINDFINLQPYVLKKREVPLREIDTETIIPECIYKENEDRLQELITIIADNNKPIAERILARNEINGYCVAIPRWAFKEAIKDGLLAEYLRYDHNNQGIPRVSYMYTREMGVQFEADRQTAFY